MALDPNLREELTHMLQDAWERTRTEVVLTTGESFPGEALDVARRYMRASPRQQGALIAVLDSWD